MRIDFDFGVACYSGYDSDGNAEIQHDSLGRAAAAGSHPSYALTPLNTYARPLDPDKGSDGSVGVGASLMTMMVGSARYVMPFLDPREVNFLPKVKKGGWMAAGGAGAVRSFIVVDGLDPNGVARSGSIQAVAKYGDKAHAFVMNVRTDGKEDVSLIHGDGQRVTLGGDGNAISLTSSNGKRFVKLDDSGLALAAAVTIQGSLIVGEPEAATPVALAEGVIAALQAITNQLAALATIVGALTPGSPTPAPGATAPIVAALQGIAATLDAIPAQHTWST